MAASLRALKFIVGLLIAGTTTSYAQKAPAKKAPPPTVAPQPPPIPQTQAPRKKRASPEARQSARVKATQDSSGPPAERQFTIGSGFWTWTEEIALDDGTTKDTDFANYKADAVTVGFRSVRGHWGWDVEGLAMVGRASAGGNSDYVSYKGQKNWSGYGLKLGGYYRWTRPVEVGIGIPVIMRDPKWAAPTNFVVEGKAGVLVTPLFFWRVFLFPNVLLEQGIGPLGTKGQAMWNLQLKYHF